MGRRPLLVVGRGAGCDAGGLPGFWAMLPDPGPGAGFGGAIGFGGAGFGGAGLGGGATGRGG